MQFASRCQPLDFVGGAASHASAATVDCERGGSVGNRRHSKRSCIRLSHVALLQVAGKVFETTQFFLVRPREPTRAIEQRSKPLWRRLIMCNGVLLGP